MHRGMVLRARMRATLVLVATALVVAVSGGLARAADGEAPDEKWHLDLDLGLWGTSVAGDTAIGPLDTDVDVSFADLAKHLNFAAMGGLELTKSNWVIAFNGFYAKLEDSGSGPRGVGEVDMTADMGIMDLAIGYTLVRTKLGSTPLSLTPAVGARYTTLSLDLEPERLPSRSRTKDWVDPYFGGEAVLGLTRTLDWRTTGSIGGAGGESNLEWSAATYLDWQFAKGWTLNVGYRALAWNFEDDDFKWDITFFGPWIGLTVRLF